MLEDKLKIAVLGDLHGHIHLVLSILKRWEREHSTTLDLILQVGDLGYFPEPHLRLDKATKRFSEKDLEELGFSLKFLGDTPFSRRFFYDQETKIYAPLVFVSGNHEDQEALDELKSSSREKPIPVDHYKRILYLPTGEVYEIEKGELKIRITGLGGISPESRNNGIRFTNPDLRKVKSLESIDILLTHEPPKGSINKEGSEEVKDVLIILKPEYHFCGHLHIDGQALNQVGNTKSYILNEVNFRKRHKLNHGCIGILTIGEGKKTFEFLEEPWLEEYKRDTYLQN